jgi:hypothetical protein
MNRVQKRRKPAEEGPPAEREERRRVQLWGSSGTSPAVITADMFYISAQVLEE